MTGFDVGGVRDIIGPLQQSFVHPVGSTDLLVRSLSRFATEPATAASLTTENLQRVARYSTERVARMFVERIATADLNS
jgi:hypothetical protein